MCGIVGLVGHWSAQKTLIEGLRTLEYRGYDSAGLAVHNGEQILISRSEGELKNLEEKISNLRLEGKAGIAHTRWATHGAPTEINAHPHRAGPVSVVHNGIFENYAEEKKRLKKKGHEFLSETDTEVFAHLVQDLTEQADSPEEIFKACREAFSRVQGSSTFLVLHEKAPESLFALKKGSPLLIAIKDEANQKAGLRNYLVASDPQAVLKESRSVIYLEDLDCAHLTDKNCVITDLRGRECHRPKKELNWTPDAIEKKGYPHFMLKEIHEQPIAARNTLQAHGLLENIQNTLSERESKKSWQSLCSPALWTNVERIVMVACGTAWHAAQVGKFLFEKVTRIPVEVDLGSEFRYRDPIVDEKTLCIAISQSGETADTLAALDEAKRKGAKSLSICNVQGSTLTRHTDEVFYTKAGPEIGVASTKAFTTQLLALTVLAYDFAKARKMTIEDEKTLLTHLVELPVLMEEVLSKEDTIKSIGEELVQRKSFLFIGRNTLYPISLEGALKLKEIAYVHAEGFAAGELKHGPIAMVDQDVVCVVLAPRNGHFEKTLGNLEEVKARNGGILGIGTEGDDSLLGLSHWMISLPPIHEMLYPILSVLPLQLLSYTIANALGKNVDRPRNLAKSVTVE